MIKKLSSLLLLFSFTAQAGLPPTTIQGQSDASAKPKFAFQVPNSQFTDLGGIKALIETGNQNYINDPGAENPNGPTTWATYANTAQATPVTGAGGAPTVTWTRTTTSPLRGTGSFLFTKTAVNSQGQGVAYDFTVSNADQAKVLTVSFDYAVASGTYLDGDLTVYIYDKTNGVVIQPAGFKILSAATGLSVKQVSTTFQTASNSTSYRLIFHCASTSSSAYSIKFDSISVSPQIITQGTPVTDWQSYTPTFSASFGSPSNVNVKYRKVGDTIEVHGTFTTGVVTNAIGTIGLPPGLSIDTAKYSSNPNYTVRVGSLDRLINATVAIYNQSASSTAMALILDPASPSSVYVSWEIASGTYTGQGVSSIISNPETLFFEFRAPIVGWSSQVQMSSDTSTRVISAVYYNSGGSATANTAITSGWNKIDDKANAFNTSTGQYIVQVPGDYQVTWYFQGSVAGVRAKIYKNNTSFAYGPEQNGTGPTGSVSVIVPNCVAGDLIDPRTDVTTTIYTSTDRSIFSIQRISGPSQIAAGEKIRAKYRISAAGISSSTTQPLNFDQMVYDSHGAVTASAAGTGSWKFTAPRADWYRISATTYAAANVQVLLYKNGSQYESIGVINTAIGEMSGGDEIYLLTGDYIDLRFGTSTTTGGAGSGSLHVEISAGGLN